MSFNKIQIINIFILIFYNINDKNLIFKLIAYIYMCVYMYFVIFKILKLLY